MKKMENTFAVTGFVGKDASIHQFSTASVARFSLAISRIEKNGEENTRTSAFMNVEAWRKNENTSSFDRLVKGALLPSARVSSQNIGRSVSTIAFQTPCCSAIAAPWIWRHRWL